jgi:hypothetical protein
MVKLEQRDPAPTVQRPISDVSCPIAPDENDAITFSNSLVHCDFSFFPSRAETGGERFDFAVPANRQRIE